MPRLIDWSARFEFIREAVVRVAARDGGAAVAIDSVAAELQISGSTLRRTLSSADALPYLGVEWIVRLRRYAQFKLPANLEWGTIERLVKALRREFPCDEEELARERAWAALTVEGASDPIVRLRDDYHEYLDLLVEGIVAKAVTDPTRTRFEAIRLRALMDGLLAAACRGSITIEDQQATFDSHVAELMASDENPVSPSGA